MFVQYKCVFLCVLEGGQFKGSLQGSTAPLYRSAWNPHRGTVADRGSASVPCNNFQMCLKVRSAYGTGEGVLVVVGGVERRRKRRKKKEKKRRRGMSL